MSSFIKEPETIINAGCIIKMEGNGFKLTAYYSLLEANIIQNYMNSYWRICRNHLKKPLMLIVLREKGFTPQNIENRKALKH